MARLPSRISAARSRLAPLRWTSCCARAMSALRLPWVLARPCRACWRASSAASRRGWSGGWG
eukprot:4823758-Alexandrium_andersonii.AAC.1